jgi:dTDP-4-dehydrorhamnose 3,5-epimerase
MTFQPMSIEGAWLFTPNTLLDSRGSFQESFRLDKIESTLGRAFTVKQINQSVSKAGVLRGIHFAKNPPGQAKYVTCVKGSVWDLVVDLRVGSPTFGQSEATLISESNGLGVLIEKGLGHAFLALDDDSTVSYLCDEYYSPENEFALSIFDPDLNIDLHKISEERGIKEILLSDKDKAAPALSELTALGVLPTYL